MSDKNKKDLQAALKDAISISELLKDVGESINSAEVLTKTLSRVSPLSISSISEILSIIIQLPSAQKQPIELSVISTVLKKLSAPNVLSTSSSLDIGFAFDNVHFKIPERFSFELLFSLWSSIFTSPFPLTAFTSKPWKKSPLGQIQFLSFAIHCNSSSSPSIDWTKLSNLQSLPTSITPTLTSSSSSSSTSSTSAASSPSASSPSSSTNKGADTEPLSAAALTTSCWRSIDLIQTILGLIELDGLAARPLFDSAISSASELFLLGLARVEARTAKSLATSPSSSTTTSDIATSTPPPRPSEKSFISTVIAEYATQLVPLYLPSTAPNSSAMISELWSIAPSVLCRGFLALYQRDPSTLNRVLDISQDLKSLSPILNALLALGTHLEFAIDLAAVASRREFLNLDKWTTESIANSKLRGPFVTALLSYISANYTRVEVKVGPKKIETLSSFLKVLNTNISLLEPSVAEEIKKIQTSAVSLYPDIQLDAFAPEVEEQANSYFQKIYLGSLSIEEVIELLKKFKASSEPREKEIFTCMVHNLFDEYRYFNKYPDRELKITGILFGSLIQHHILHSSPLGYALRYVLDALRKPQSSKMFKFGTFALEQFKERLHEWPQYCSQVLQITALREERLDIVKYIEKTLANPPANTDGTGSPAPSAKSLGSSSTTSSSTASSSTPAKKGTMNSFTSMNIDTLLSANSPETKVVTPPQPTQDRIHFIFNNISASTLEAKSKELLSFLQSAHYPFVAQYLVIKRASIEPNFHALYISFIDALGEKTLWKQIYRVTVSNCQVLLRSPKIKKSSSERSLLKNLGSWLGAITLARNRPVLQIDIDLKKLLFHAYEQGRLIGILPFVAKILESAAKSKIFKPPNPWLVSILRVLVELYNIPDLKLNMKFEIEVLLKNLKIDMSDIKPAAFLKALHVDRSSNTDFTGQAAPDSRIMMPGTGFAAGPAGAHTMPQRAAPFIPGHDLTGSGSAAGRSGLSGPPNLGGMGGTHGFGGGAAGVGGDKSNVVFTSQAENVPSHQHGAAGGIGGMSGLSRFTAAAAAAAAGAGGAASGGGQPHSAGLGGIPGAASMASTSSSTTVIPNLANYVQVNPNLPLFFSQHHLKPLVPMAVERAIREIINPVVERSVTIACITTRELVLKDFAMEPDEGKMRDAAHLMVQNLAGSLALVTCKEPLRGAMGAALRSLLSPNGGANGDPQQLLVEQAVQLITSENIELGCNLIEKAATEKAVKDIDETLARAFSDRRKAREKGQNYFDVSQLSSPSASHYANALPEGLRHKASGLHPAQFRVYSDFTRTSTMAGAAGGGPGAGGAAGGFPGAGTGSNAAAPPALSVGGSAAPGSGTYTPHQAMERFQLAMSELDNFVAPISDESILALPPTHDVFRVLRAINSVIAASTSMSDVVTTIAQKVFKSLYKAEARLYQDVHYAILELVREHHEGVAKDITAWLIAEEDRVLSRDVTVDLIKYNLILARDYTDHIVKQLMSNNNLSPQQKEILADSGLYFIQKSLIEDHLATFTDFANLVDCLQNLLQKRKGSENVVKMLESARQVKALSSRVIDARATLAHRVGRVLPVLKGDGHSEGKDANGDPIGLREKVTYLFDEWIKIASASSISEKAVANYITSLKTHGVLATDDASSRFFRILMERCVDISYSFQSQNYNYHAVDAYAKLVVILVKVSRPPPPQTGQAGAAGSGNNAAVNRVSLLSKICEVVVRVLLRDYELTAARFNQRPYFRFFVMLMIELNSAEVDATYFQILTTFANTFHKLQPARLPAFAFAWLELISHRTFMPKLLLAKGQKGWPLFQRLLVVLFKFLEPFLRNAQLTDSSRLLYKGTLRVLLVLLKDFPDFLCDFHFSFCDVIPPSCIQMRNLILSAFPKNMRLPDPFTPNLKVDLLPEIEQSPRILSNPAANLQASGLKDDIDIYLKNREPKSFLANLKDRLLLPAQEIPSAGTKYNVPVINGLTLYVGMQAIGQVPKQGATNPQAILYSAALDIYQSLCLSLDTEGRYLFLNAIANQLRYPNNHTFYFNCVLLCLFNDAREEIIQEQITRVLLERLLAQRPHPWGILISIIELLKNRKYLFWTKAFTRISPEIENIFQSIARSCIPSNNSNNNNNNNNGSSNGTSGTTKPGEGAGDVKT